ncbi:MAG: TonB-dependent receptor, partial [Bacteroidota bacterium]
RVITTFGEEIRLGSTDTEADFSWLAGAFLYRYTYDNQGNITAGADNAFFATTPENAAQYPYIQRQNAILTQTGVSFYVNGDYKLTPELKVTAGLRYEIERSQSDNVTSFSRNGDEGYSFPPLNLIPASFDESVNFDAFSPKVGLSYQLNPNQLLYANVARGYRPGGINAFSSTEESLKYDPEFTWNYEVGYKSTLLENRLRFNLTGFYIDYTDQQLITVTDLSTFSLGNQNIGKSISYGLELETELLLTKGLTVSLNGGWLETEIKEYKVVGFAGEIDNAGNRNAYAPSLNGSLGLSYRTTLGKVRVGANADYQYQSEIFLDPENQYSQPAYGLLSARISACVEHYELAIWGRNLADIAYFSYGYSLPGFGGFGSYGLPRMVGTSFSVKF